MEDLSAVPSNEGPGQNDAIEGVAEISCLIIPLAGFHNTPALCYVDEPGILVWLDTLPFSHFSISAPTLTYHDARNRRDASRECVQCSIFVKSLLLATPLFGNV